MGFASRGMALRAVFVFLIGTAIGSTLPESGNIVVHVLGMDGNKPHIFNWVFLTLGIIGIGVALYIGYRRRGSGT